MQLEIKILLNILSIICLSSISSTSIADLEDDYGANLCSKIWEILERICERKNQGIFTMEQMK